MPALIYDVLIYDVLIYDVLIYDVLIYDVLFVGLVVDINNEMKGGNFNFKKAVDTVSEPASSGYMSGYMSRQWLYECFFYKRTRVT